MESIQESPSVSCSSRSVLITFFATVAREPASKMITENDLEKDFAKGGHNRNLAAYFGSHRFYLLLCN